MKQTYPLFLLFTLFLFAGCSPIYVVRLDPSVDETPDRMLYGNAVLSERVDAVDISLSYYDASPEYIVFNLEVFNGGPTAFDFNPPDVSITTDLGQTQRAIDPELQLLTMDLDEARRRKNKRTMAWAGGALMVAASVASVTGEFSSSETAFDNAQVIANTSYDLSNLLLTAVADANLRSMQHYSVPREEIPLPSSRYFWLDHSLRITTIGPEERVVGKLLFQRVDEARQFTVNVPVPGGLGAFRFDQRVFKP